MGEDRLIEAIESVRRDKKDPWHYIFFTFLNGLAQGLGVALGMTLVLGIVVYFLSLLIANMINFPVVGKYFVEIGKLLDAYLKAVPKVR